MIRSSLTLLSALALLGCTGTQQGEATLPSEPAMQTASYANHPFAFLFGDWEGTASGTSPDGQPYKVRQTERVEPRLGGDIVTIEGRGFDDTGKTAFNAYAVVSATQTPGQYEMRSYAMGRAGTFDLQLTGTGFVWELPAGPKAVMRYTANIEGEQWTQVGAYVPEQGPEREVFTMELTRVAPLE